MTSLHPRRRSMRVMAALAIAGSLFVAGLFFVEVRRRHDLYWYDVSLDYRFVFTATRSTSVPVNVSPHGFVFPQADAAWDTAVLRLGVASTPAARWFEPSITVQAGGSADRQVFERGARGERYVLFSAATVQPGQTVGLHGEHLAWPSQRAELLLFDNSTAAAPTILVLAPHPDDAEIAAFGLYSAHDSYVVTITPGNYVDRSYAHLSADDAGRETLKAQVRTWDSLVVPSWGGVSRERTVNLGYCGLSLAQLYAERNAAPAGRATADARFGQFRQGAVDALLAGRTATATWASLVEDLATLVTRVRPDIVVAPHPALDVSADHQLTTVALLEALGTAGDEDATLFLYTNHHVLAEYFPFGPADSTITLPPWFDGSLAFDGVYSHPLDERRQLDKLFALDAMHDLRAAPRRLLGGPGDRFALRLSRSIADLIRDPVADYSYYRRAVRPNELFFVHRPGSRRALASWAARRTSPVAGAR